MGKGTGKGALDVELAGPDFSDRNTECPKCSDIPTWVKVMIGINVAVVVGGVIAGAIAGAKDNSTSAGNGAATGLGVSVGANIVIDFAVGGAYYVANRFLGGCKKSSQNTSNRYDVPDDYETGPTDPLMSSTYDTTTTTTTTFDGSGSIPTLTATTIGTGHTPTPSGSRSGSRAGSRAATPVPAYGAMA